MFFFTIFKKIENASWFSSGIVLVILFAGALVGIQTYPNIVQEHADLLSLLDQLILWIFAFEIIVKWLARWPRPWEYFLDGWNVFDFIIVAICFLPIQGGEFITILRMARILRVFKLVTALPRLQLLVGALLKSIPSMGYVFLLLFLQFYIYAAIGTFLFRENDPLHFGTLLTSLLSLFRAVTLEDWTDLMYINMYGSDQYGYDASTLSHLSSMGHEVIPSAMPIAATLYFVSFILFGSMMVLNLFIGVIMNGMDQAKEELEQEHLAKEAKKQGERSTELEINLIASDLNALVNRLKKIQKQVEEKNP